MENTGTLKITYFNSIVKMLENALKFFLGVYFVQIGLSGGQIGIIFAIGIITSIITILPSGFSNDSFHSKHLIGIGLILMATLYIGLFVTKEFSFIATLFLLGGIGQTLYNNSAESFFYKSVNSGDKDSCSKQIGIFQGSLHLMTAIGMVSSGLFLNAQIDFTNLFLMVGTSFLIMAAISQFLLPKKTIAKFEIIGYKKDIFRAKVLYFALIIFLLSFHFGAETTSYGLFLKNNLGLSPLYMGLYMGTSVVIMGTSFFVIAKNVKKWGAHRVLLGGLLLSGLGHILMTIEIPLVSLLFRIIHETGDSAWLFFLSYGITRLFDLQRIGGNAGVFTFIATIASAFGAMIMGPLGDSYGYNWPLIFTGITTLVAFFLAAQFLHHFKHES